MHNLLISLGAGLLNLMGSHQTQACMEWLA